MSKKWVGWLRESRDHPWRPVLETSTYAEVDQALLEIPPAGPREESMILIRGAKPIGVCSSWPARREPLSVTPGGDCLQVPSPAANVPLGISASAAAAG
ncbi:MAG TPA: hypothetical protein VK395_07685 [Gemmataceae bacterium]|nr:hypothetical protein [Gemmataceae bacterium]